MTVPRTLFVAGQADAAPELLAALDRCAILLADYAERDGEKGDAYREAIAVITAAIRNFPTISSTMQPVERTREQRSAPPVIPRILH